MNILSWIISLVSGAIGGNVAGATMKENSLGTIGNSIAGIVGGGAGAAILQSVLGAGAPAANGGADIGSVIGNIAGGGVGGAILMAIIGLVKQAATKKA